MDQWQNQKQDKYKTIDQLQKQEQQKKEQWISGKSKNKKQRNSN